MTSKDGKPTGPVSRRTIVEEDNDETPESEAIGSANDPSPSSRKTIVESADGNAPSSRRTIVEATDRSAPSSRRTMVEPTGDSTPVPNPLAAAPDKLRQTILEAIEETPVAETVESQTAKQPRKKADAAAAQRFHPTVRAPMAKLFVLDDSGTDAEVIRIRQDAFRIGRSAGDLVISHDGQMSSEHVEIARQLKDNGEWSWRLRDLNSTNGTFVRVTETPLSDEQELFLGGRLYRFQKEEGGEAPSTVVIDHTKTMVAGGSTSAASTDSATLTEVKLGGPGRRITLQADQWIGRDRQHCLVVLQDPMLGDQEARIYRDSSEQWFVKRGKSLNGVWVRVAAVAIQGRGAHFQCGEQRFEIRLG